MFEFTSSQVVTLVTTFINGAITVFNVVCLVYIVRVAKKRRR